MVSRAPMDLTRGIVKVDPSKKAVHNIFILSEIFSRFKDVYDQLTDNKVSSVGLGSTNGLRLVRKGEVEIKSKKILGLFGGKDKVGQGYNVDSDSYNEFRQRTINLENALIAYKQSLLKQENISETDESIKKLNVYIIDCNLALQELDTLESSLGNSAMLKANKILSKFSLLSKELPSFLKSQSVKYKMAVTDNNVNLEREKKINEKISKTRRFLQS